MKLRKILLGISVLLAMGSVSYAATASETVDKAAAGTEKGIKKGAAGTEKGVKKGAAGAGKGGPAAFCARARNAL